MEFLPMDETGVIMLANAKIETCSIFLDVDAWCEWAFTLLKTWNMKLGQVPKTWLVFFLWIRVLPCRRLRVPRSAVHPAETVRILHDTDLRAFNSYRHALLGGVLDQHWRRSVDTIRFHTTGVYHSTASIWLFVQGQWSLLKGQP